MSLQRLLLLLLSLDRFLRCSQGIRELLLCRSDERQEEVEVEEDEEEEGGGGLALAKLQEEEVVVVVMVVEVVEEEAEEEGGGGRGRRRRRYLALPASLFLGFLEALPPACRTSLETCQQAPAFPSVAGKRRQAMTNLKLR